MVFQLTIGGGPDAVGVGKSNNTKCVGRIGKATREKPELGIGILRHPTLCMKCWSL